MIWKPVSHQITCHLTHTAKAIHVCACPTALEPLHLRGHDDLRAHTDTLKPHMQVSRA